MSGAAEDDGVSDDVDKSTATLSKVPVAMGSSGAVVDIVMFVTMVSSVG